MKRTILILLAVIAATAAVYWADKATRVHINAAPRPVVMKAGDSAPEIKVKDLEDKDVTLADYKGKVVVLDFYATWCEPCRAETPHLVDLQKQYADKGLQVIGLNVGGEDDRAQVPAYAKEFGIQYPLAYPDDDLVDQLLSDNQNIPQSFVYDRNGKLIKRFIGFESSGGASQIERVVQQALTVNTIAGQPAN